MDHHGRAARLGDEEKAPVNDKYTLCRTMYILRRWVDNTR